MNEVLKQLSLKSLIKIENTFTWFFATKETIRWKIKVEHCTHRGMIFEFNGNDLDVLFQDALDQMNSIEQDYEKKVSALGVLYPNKNEYEIAEMARNL